MAQHLLEMPDVGASLEHVGRTGVSEGVRGDPFFHPGLLGIFCHDGADGSYPQSLAPAVEEEGRLLLFLFLQEVLSDGEEAVQAELRSHPSQGHHPLFIKCH